MNVDALGAGLSDRYRIERELGQGGMATVYLAQDLKHKRQVAIKVLRPELAQAVGAERFLLEIETTASLRHPHILPLYDSGSVEGFLFYVMPLVEGESLRDRLDRDRQISVEEAVRIAREVADALGYAHARGVVHRDIKPENILLEGGHAVIADFGIARAMSAAGADRLTQTGTSIGTPLYMSPEQAAGDPDLDGRSDLYSLGCVLYEMLGGQPPFTGPTAEAVTRQHMLTEAAPVTNLRPTVPPEVAGALARTLAKNPADRFSPASQFVQALSSGDRGPARATRAGLRPMVIATAALAVATAGWFGRAALRGEGEPPPVERIAVLPMDNQTGDSGQAFFADGMTRELIGVLTDAGVRVMGHRAVMPYAGSTLPMGQIARELDVDALVTAAVLASGDVIQVAVELTDPKSGESLWARTFSRPAAEVVTLQREVAREIARGIQARLTPEQEGVLATPATVNPRAYAQYLLGQEQANLRTPDGYRRSVEHFNRAIALDSTFAPTWAGMAMTNAYGLLYQSAPRAEARAAVVRAAARATQLDDHLGDPYFALGLVRLHGDWDFAEAEAEFARGLARPHSAMARALYAWTNWELGEFAKSVSASLVSIEWEPTTGQWYSDLAWGYWSGGDGVRARVAALRAIELDSTFYEPNDVLSYTYADAGEHELAERAHQRAKEVAGGTFWFDPIARGIISHARGDTAAIRGALRALGEDDPRHGQKAFLHFALGEKDRMYQMFHRALDSRDPDVLWILNAVPALYPIRSEQEYQRVLARLGLPEALRQ